MKVLMITGDKSFGPGHPRFELQKSAVEELAVIYWGRGALWPKIPKGQFDVVTVQDPFWRGLFARVVARRLGVKLNVQVHTDLAVQSLLRRVLAQIVLRHADSVRVVSEKIKNQIHVRARVSVLPIFVDIERFRTIERHPEPNTLLWVGRFEQEKNPFLALEIAARVPGAKLTMLGRGSLEVLLKQKGGAEFPGWQDPAPYFARASVVLCTSRHESWGASIVEALAAGVPVVAPDVGIAKEAGAIVVPRAELARAVIEVLKSGARGELKLLVLSAEEWAQKWKQSLEVTS